MEAGKIVEVKFIHQPLCVENEEDQLKQSITSRLQIPRRYESENTLEEIDKRHEELVGYAYQYQEDNIRFCTAGLKSYNAILTKDVEIRVLPEILPMPEFMKLFSTIRIVKFTISSEENLHVPSVMSFIGQQLKLNKKIHSDYRVWMHVDKFKHEQEVDIVMIIHLETPEFDCKPLYTMKNQCADFTWSCLAEPFRGVSGNWTEAFHKLRNTLDTDVQLIIKTVSPPAKVELKNVQIGQHLDVSGIETRWIDGVEKYVFRMNSQTSDNKHSFYFIQNKGDGLVRYVGASPDPVPVLYDKLDDLQRELTQLRKADTQLLKLIHTQSSTLIKQKAC